MISDLTGTLSRFDDGFKTGSKIAPDYTGAFFLCHRGKDAIETETGHGGGICFLPGGLHS